MTLKNRPHEAVIRQFARAVTADRLIGDELARLTLASGAQVSDDASTTHWLRAFIELWRQGAAGMQPAANDTIPFSDTSLRAALPPPPKPERLLLLLSDILGLAPADAADLAGIEVLDGDQLLRARQSLSIPKSTVVLIVEDDPITAADIASTVQQLGPATVAIARTAGEAVVKARESRPDIVLTDYDLAGDRTGIDAVRAIRQTYDCAAIFISAFPDSVLKGQEGEPDFVLSKPFDRYGLRAAIAHTLDARRG